MAKKTFLVDIDLAKNELQNAAIQNLGEYPTAPVKGQIFYHTTEKKLKMWDGSWEDVGKDYDISKMVTSTNALGDDTVILGAGGRNVESSSLVTGSDLVVMKAHSESAHAPSDAEKNVNADWNAISGDAQILNKPTTITAGQIDNINDNTDKLSGIDDGAEINVQSDWNQTSNAKDDYIKNKPTIPTIDPDIVTAALTLDTDYLIRGDGAKKVEKTNITSTQLGIAIQGINDHVANSSNPHSVTKLQIGLNNVDNTSDAAKPISTAQATENAKAFHKDGSVIATGHFDLGNKRINNMAMGTAGQDAVTLAQMNTAIDSVTGGVSFQGGYNAQMDLPPLEANSGVGIEKGWMYAVTVAGSFYGVNLEIGNSIIANKDVPSVKTDWTLLHGDLDHASETKAGIAEIATNMETQNGSDDTRFLTPLKNRIYNYAKKIAKTVKKTIPAGGTTQTISLSGLNTANGIVVQVRDASGDEYQFRVTSTGSDVTFTSNVDIPAGLTAYVTAATTNS